MAGVSVGDRAWIARVEARAAEGQAVPFAVQKMFTDLTGRHLLFGGKHARRPDSSDRRAGDDSFDEQVAI